MATKAIGKATSNKASASTKKVGAKKAAAKKGVAKKAPARQLPPPKATAKKPPTGSQATTKAKGEDNPTVPLIYAIGILAVENDIAGLRIDGTFYPLERHMGYPVSILMPKHPEEAGVEACFVALRLAMREAGGLFGWPWETCLWF